MANSLSLTFGLTRPITLHNAASILLAPAFFLANLEDKNTQLHVELSRINSDFKLSNDNANDEKKYNLIKLRVNTGDEESEIDLGILKTIGKYGAKIDYEEARRIFEKYPNNKRANAFLGKLYHFGYGVEKNKSIAKDYYEKSAFKRDPNGQEGLCLLKLENDDFDVVECFESAMKMGSPEAALNLGILNLRGTKTLPKNITKAYELFKPFLGEKVPLSLVAVAEMLMRGSYEHNLKQALVYLWDVMQGGPWNNLGKSAENFFNNKEYEKALLAWMMLGDIGIERAAYNAGIMLMNHKLFFPEKKSF
ncbi:ERAD pathway [Trichomonas vaginalis G3]|uniref:ERAD pathway n=1 Tax=Trichomonas vaginalis (strain ATCC PRA-98 / G3) TaxID=412133 RepID=UPI0021E55F90|nr:ERAD pathway [Trichomonas vaginalis G3]KAI5507341.1 ERAD pathway [Trichomonas vaginalis G3]